MIKGVWHEHGNDREFETFPKDAQVSCVGNIVCPPLAEAEARSNYEHSVKMKKDFT